MWPDEDSQGLYNAPAVPNAVEWSEDNLVAVATGPAAVIFNPSHLPGNLPSMLHDKEQLCVRSPEDCPSS